MKKRNSYNHSFTLRTACRTLACCAAWMAASCTNNGFDETIPDLDTPFAFGVSVPEAWTEGTEERAERTTGLYVDKMTRSDGAEPLYLVTEIAEQDDTAAEKPETRGTQIGKIEDFHASFGLSGVCRASGTDANDMTTNVAHDLKMTRASDKSPWAAADGTVIHRPGSGTVTFYAYAPHSSDESLKGALKHAADKPSITYTVPDDPEEQLDIMTATADCDGAGSGDVNLAFGHALTAVTIKAGDAMLGGKITEVKISGVYGSGTHTIGSGKWTASGDLRTFTITKEIALPDTSDDNSYTKPDTPIIGDKLTLMMIPQTLPDGAAITIKFRDNLSQSDRTLTASLKGKTWPAGRKVTYSISSTGVAIKPKVDLTPTRTDVHPSGDIFGVKLAAYAYVAQEGQGDKAPIVALPYTVEYATSTEDGVWSDWTAGEWIPDTEPAEDAKPTTQVAGRIKLKPQQSFEKLREPFALTDAGIGSATAPYDLSQGGETANCYMINDHGYYSLPTIYGNARGAGGATNTKAYIYQGTVPAETQAYVLTQFVDHDNKYITKPEIDGIADAVLVWQDAPDLVTDVKYENDMVRFRVAKQTLTQGNAVIAVRNAAKTILWSWHIWVTPSKWDGTTDLKAIRKDGIEGDAEYYFAPCNLGFCEPHGGDKERTFKLRFTFTLPDGKATKKIEEYKDTFVQPEIVESAAGDNTYYQWGRKDPMLGGVYNSETLDRAASLATDLQTQYNMQNKVCYPSAPEYDFRPAESGVSIGEAIRQPYLFFMHSYDETTVSGDIKEDHNYRRRHWHDGSKTTGPDGKPGQKTIMNYWNSQLDKTSSSSKFDAPNGAKVVKTIYDPCPVGYNVPTPNAFSQFGNAGVNALNAANANGLEDIFNENGIRIGWKLSLQPGGGEPKIFFPATGLRDMGSAKSPTIPDYVQNTTWPAHADLTFVITTAFTTGGNSSALLFYLDRREASQNIAINGGTNNSYGFTVRPVRESK